MEELSETLNSDHFHKFVTYSKLWIKHLGLGDWEIRYLFCEAEEDSPRASAEIVDVNNRLVFITLYDDWDIKPTCLNLKRVALHEVLEVLLSDFWLLAANRDDFSVARLDRENHRVIRRLENFVEGIHEGKVDIREIGDGEGSEIPEVDNDHAVPGSRLHGIKLLAGRWLNRLSPFKRPWPWRRDVD